MSDYTGIYYQEGTLPRPATVSFQRNWLSVALEDEYGKPLFVYWDYSKIIRKDFWKGDKVVVQYIGFPVQVIEVPSTRFLAELESRLRKKEGSVLKKSFGHNAAGLLKVLFIIGVIIAAAYFWGVPFLAERLATKVPVSYEEEMGEGMYAALKSDFEIDEIRTLLVNDFFSELKIPSDYDIKITVVKGDITNAFALPGGHIIIYSKLLDQLDNYEELSALLAHEFTHIQKKHTTRSVFRQLGSSVFLSVVLGKTGSLANSAISRADQLKSLHYSRKLEKEADLYGLKILSERKIDGEGFIDLFEVLKKDDGNQRNDEPAEWISSHPDLDKRIQYIKKEKGFNQNGVQSNELLQSVFSKLKKEGSTPW